MQGNSEAAVLTAEQEVARPHLELAAEDVRGFARAFVNPPQGNAGVHLETGEEPDFDLRLRQGKLAGPSSLALELVLDLPVASTRGKGQGKLRADGFAPMGRDCVVFEEGVDGHIPITVPAVQLVPFRIVKVCLDKAGCRLGGGKVARLVEHLSRPSQR